MSVIRCQKKMGESQNFGIQIRRNYFERNIEGEKDEKYKRGDKRYRGYSFK